MKEYKRLGVIGRFRPLHVGSAVMLETLCEKAEHVIIGIGSVNKYNMRNPFTAEETKDMINLHLSPRYSNYEIVFIPDSGHIPDYSDGKKWAQDIKEAYGKLDAFITANAYVEELLKDSYKIIHPVVLIPIEKQIKLKGTEVRVRIAAFDHWESLVPKDVADYLNSNKLVERFRKEFGLQTLAELANGLNYYLSENMNAERLHAMEV